MSMPPPNTKAESNLGDRVVASEKDGIVLLCCPACEDVLRGIEGSTRECACGQSRIALRHDGHVEFSPRTARLLLIPWERFDGLRGAGEGSVAVL